MSDAYSSQLDFESGRWRETGKFPLEKPNASLTHNKSQPQALLEAEPLRSSEQEGAEADALWQEGFQETELEGTTITKEACTEAIQTSFGNTAFFATISLQKPMSIAMEHKYPDV